MRAYNKSNKPLTFIGTPCPVCGGTKRYIKSHKCEACTRERQRKARLASMEVAMPIPEKPKKVRQTIFPDYTNEVVKCYS